MSAVTMFARETGDIHALSSADIKLLALAHSLEVAAHGNGHLRERPEQVRPHSTLPQAFNMFVRYQA